MGKQVLPTDESSPLTHLEKALTHMEECVANLHASLEDILSAKQAGLRSEADRRLLRGVLAETTATMNELTTLKPFLSKDDRQRSVTKGMQHLVARALRRQRMLDQILRDVCTSDAADMISAIDDDRMWGFMELLQTDLLFLQHLVGDPWHADAPATELGYKEKPAASTAGTG